MAEQPCLPQVSACVMRLGALEADGTPAAGPANLYVTEALVTMGVTHVYKDGVEIEQENACGSLCLSYRAPDYFKRIDVSIQLCTPDPFASSLLTSNGAILTDGLRKGFAAPSLGVVTGNGLSIELWAKRIDNGDLDPDSPYAWWAYPKIKNLRLGEHSHGNSALLPTFTGQGYENPNWLDGPVNDWPAESDRVWQWIPTDTIPSAACSLLELAAS